VWANSALRAASYSYGVTLNGSAYVGYVFGPVGADDVYLSGSATNDFSLYATVYNPGVAGVASDLPQIITGTLTGTPVTGYTYRLTLDGVNFDFIATASETTMSLVATALAAVVDADAAYTAAAVGAVITITGVTAGDSWAFAADVIGSTVTLTATTTQEAT
jgi:hypothetical protein